MDKSCSHPITNEDKFWILNKEEGLIEKVILRLKCRVLSHYSEDPRIECMLILDNHNVIINEYQKENLHESWGFRYGLIVLKDGIIACEYHHNDLNIVLKWKDKIKACSKQGSFFSKYRKIEDICRTPASNVVKVQNLHDLKVYAAKIFNLKKTNSDKSYIVNEVRMMRRLDHIGLAKLHEVYKEKGSIILIMDYYNGGDLSTKLSKCKSYKEEKASKLMKNLFEIIKYLDDQCIVHKDIKPTNILLCNEHNDIDIKLIDFELSSYTHFHTINKYNGTPGYMAPEIFKEQDITIKSDMYACGLVLYYLLTGSPAFCGIDIETRTEENYNGVISFDNLFWRNISEDCKSLLKSLLSKNPKDRPTPLQALKSSWIRKYSTTTSDLKYSIRKYEQQRKTKEEPEQHIPEINLFTSINYNDTIEILENYNTTSRIRRLDIFFKKECYTDDDYDEFPQKITNEPPSPPTCIHKIASIKNTYLHNETNSSLQSFTKHLDYLLKYQFKAGEENYSSDIDENLNSRDLERHMLMSQLYNPFKTDLIYDKHANNNIPNSITKLEHLYSWD